MINPFEMVVLIVLIVSIANVMRGRSGRRTNRGQAAIESAETARLREEVLALKDRLAVLERITVDKENSLAREIESLRER